MEHSLSLRYAALNFRGRKQDGLVLQPGSKNMSTGTVKWFNETKGYGFIKPDDGGADLFVHHSSIAMDGFRSLEDGQAAEYEATAGRKGPEAKDVKPA